MEMALEMAAVAVPEMVPAVVSVMVLAAAIFPVIGKKHYQHITIIFMNFTQNSKLSILSVQHVDVPRRHCEAAHRRGNPPNDIISTIF